MGRGQGPFVRQNLSFTLLSVKLIALANVAALNLDFHTFQQIGVSSVALGSRRPMEAFYPSFLDKISYEEKNSEKHKPVTLS